MADDQIVGGELRTAESTRKVINMVKADAGWRAVVFDSSGPDFHPVIAWALIAVFSGVDDEVVHPVVVIEGGKPKILSADDYFACAAPHESDVEFNRKNSELMKGRKK